MRNKLLGIILEVQELITGAGVDVGGELLLDALPRGEVGRVLVPVLPHRAPGLEDGAGRGGPNLGGGRQALLEDALDHEGVGIRVEGVELGRDVGVGANVREGMVGILVPPAAASLGGYGSGCRGGGGGGGLGDGVLVVGGRGGGLGVGGAEEDHREGGFVGGIGVGDGRLRLGQERRRRRGGQAVVVVVVVVMVVVAVVVEKVVFYLVRIHSREKGEEQKGEIFRERKRVKIGF